MAHPSFSCRFGSVSFRSLSFGGSVTRIVLGLFTRIVVGIVYLERLVGSISSPILVLLHGISQ